MVLYESLFGRILDAEFGFVKVFFDISYMDTQGH